MDLSTLMESLPKRRNMSADAEKTRERCQIVWKGLKNVQKNEVLELADASAPTLHKTYKQGHISAAVAIALAKVAGVQPMYLSGEVDKTGRFTAKTLDSFLKAHGIANPMEAAAPTEDVKEVEEAVVEFCCDCEEDDLMDGDELIILLEGLFIRARFSEKEAEKLENIKNILLS